MNLGRDGKLDWISHIPTGDNQETKENQVILSNAVKLPWRGIKVKSL